MNKVSLIAALTAVANAQGLDIEANMPDFIIGRFMSDSFDALMAANKANGEYFTLSAQDEEDPLKSWSNPDGLIPYASNT